MRLVVSKCVLILIFSTLAGASNAFAQPETPIPQQVTAQPQRSRGNTFNPDIGINALVLFQNSNRGKDSLVEDRNGISIQEAELQFSADVDPYWRFASTFSLHQEFDAGPPIEREYVFEPEEAFAETLALPYVTARIGKFKAAFGKHNLLHTHAFPFIDAPLMNQALLGDEGFNDVGASVAALLPTPWYSEVALQAFSGQGEGLEYFASEDANDLAGVLHWKNLVDLSDDFTFEAGASGATGKNANAGSTNIYGLDATFKWRPNGSRERAIVWSTEAMKRDRNQSAFNEAGRGIASWVQYQFNTRWWVQARTEYFDIEGQDPTLLPGDRVADFARRHSALLGFVPSEFSAVRLQYDHLNDGAGQPEDKVMLQFNYSIGAHPAHTY